MGNTKHYHTAVVVKAMRVIQVVEMVYAFSQTVHDTGMHTYTHMLALHSAFTGLPALH